MGSNRRHALVPIRTRATTRSGARAATSSAQDPPTEQPTTTRRLAVVSANAFPPKIQYGPRMNRELGRRSLPAGVPSARPTWYRPEEAHAVATVPAYCRPSPILAIKIRKNPDICLICYPDFAALRNREFRDRPSGNCRRRGRAMSYGILKSSNPVQDKLAVGCRGDLTVNDARQAARNRNQEIA